MEDNTLNSIIIHGRITRKPELKTTSSGVEYCNFSVAVNRPMGKDKEPITDFFDCTAWRQSGAFVERFFDAGDGVIVQGEMHSRKYTGKDGNERTAWNIDCNRVEFAEKKGDSKGKSAGGFSEVTDDEVPF